MVEFNKTIVLVIIMKLASTFGTGASTAVMFA
jgi:hypothetical protein